jgi:hypothetical protein
MVEKSPTAVSSLLHDSPPSGRGRRRLKLGQSVGTHLIVEAAGRADIDPQGEVCAAGSGMLDGRRISRWPSSMRVDATGGIISEIRRYPRRYGSFPEKNFLGRSHRAGAAASA